MFETGHTPWQGRGTARGRVGPSAPGSAPGAIRLDRHATPDATRRRLFAKSKLHALQVQQRQQLEQLHQQQEEEELQQLQEEQQQQQQGDPGLVAEVADLHKQLAALQLALSEKVTPPKELAPSPRQEVADRLLKQDHKALAAAKKAESRSSKVLSALERAELDLDPDNVKMLAEFQAKTLEEVPTSPLTPPLTLAQLGAILAPAQLPQHAPAPGQHAHAALLPPAAAHSQQQEVHEPLPLAATLPDAPGTAPDIIKMLAQQFKKSNAVKKSDDRPLKDHAAFQEEVGTFTKDLLTKAMAAAATNDGTTLQKLREFERYYNYERRFFKLVCNYSWGAASHFHKRTMNALAHSEIKVEEIGDVRSHVLVETRNSFLPRRGSCPAHPKDPHTEATCNLRIKDKDAFDKLVSEKTG